MKSSVILIPVLFSVLACNPFNQAERQLDSPNGSINDAEFAIRGSFSQDAAADIIDLTTGEVTATPFAFDPSAPAKPELISILSRKELEKPSFRLARSVLTLLHQEGALNETVPYVSGEVDVDLVTQGECSGEITFDVDIDVKLLRLFARVDATMDFLNVVCPEGSIDGFVALRTEVDANAESASFKLVEIIDATISDTVETKDVEFFLRAEAASILEQLVVDMSVVVNEESLTIRFVGDLNGANATVEVIGADGSVSCDLVNDGVSVSATCSNGVNFEI